MLHVFKFTDERLTVDNAQVDEIRITAGKTYYVDATTGSDSHSGRSWTKAFATMAKAVATAVSYDRIYVRGDITEVGLSTPTGVNFVSILGAGNVQRMARWKSDNTASPNITVNGTGWIFQNLYFAGGTAASCIYLARTATVNASESRVLNCVFNGGSCALELNGSPSNVTIKGNRFINVRGGTATQTGAIVCTGTAQAVSTNLVIENNEFYDCDYNIYASMSRSMIKHNWFQGIGHDAAATQVIDLTANAGQGSFNLVMGNYLGKANANYNNAGGFKSDANTPWVHNFALDQVEYSAAGVTA